MGRTDFILDTLQLDNTYDVPVDLRGRTAVSRIKSNLDSCCHVHKISDADLSGVATVDFA